MLTLSSPHVAFLYTLLPPPLDPDLPPPPPTPHVPPPIPQPHLVCRQEIVYRLSAEFPHLLHSTTCTSVVRCRGCGPIHLFAASVLCDLPPLLMTLSPRPPLSLPPPTSTLTLTHIPPPVPLSSSHLPPPPPPPPTTPPCPSNPVSFFARYIGACLGYKITTDR